MPVVTWKPGWRNSINLFTKINIGVTILWVYA